MTPATPLPHGGDGVLLIVPTYNEAGNLESIIARALSILPLADLLVVDDGSPDGTGDIADRIAAADPRVRVLHRQAKAGLGAAYLAGFDWALGRRYRLVVEMDADGSHPPEALPVMITTLDDRDAGLVIGSRWIAGGRVVDWPRSRELLSRGANTYARLALGIRVKDSTAGFRVYRADALRAIDLGRVDSEGYCFQIDLTLRTLGAGFTVAEVPIVFRDRAHGESKMSGGIVAEAMLKVTGWGIGRRTSQLRRLLRRQVV